MTNHVADETLGRLARRPYSAPGYSEYNRYLHSLADQLQLLRDLNRRMPRKLRVSRAWLDVDTASQHVQGVKDLEFFYVQLDTLEQTWAFNQELVRLTQPAIRDFVFECGPRAMQLHATARRYPPGIHRVRINLVDNWSPGEDRAINWVRDCAVAAGEQLAAVEPIGAYALQSPGLYQSQDGQNLPYFDMAGLKQGADFRLVPCSGWGGRLDRAVYFSIAEASKAHGLVAAPSLVL